MNMRFGFIAASAALLLTAHVAQASVVNYTGDNVNLATVALGQSGTITDNDANGSDINIAEGKIAPDSMITFSYPVTGASPTPSLSAQGTYNYTSGGQHFGGTAFANTAGTTVQAQLAQAFANITTTVNGSTATATIVNNSASMVTFLVELSGFFPKGFSYTYSAVPVPAALPLFLTGLVLLAALRSRKKQAALVRAS